MEPDQSTGEQPTESSAADADADAADAQAGSQDASANETQPKLSEDSPQAKRLAYVHDADDVIASEQPRYEEGQQCTNCQLYQGTPDDEWAGCPLFAGKLVKGTGWCNAYAPRSG
ncbi:iron permease [Kineobactrum sediminis]|uniref:High-potential iron-sulfur protein n=2 Tax=Kineobactrum sediminis TaxID=1905677 RepID=A0A2N5Y7V6_9GAMM|nr:iron permease [Kineobactrum sediminis]